MDFLADRNGRNYAMWSDEQKYYDYFTDQTGVFKTVLAAVRPERRHRDGRRGLLPPARAARGGVRALTQIQRLRALRGRL